MTTLLAGEARIGRLAVRLPDDTPAGRLAVAGRVGAADIRPSGMPPAAILIIRRVAGPAGLSAELRPAPGARAWETALRARVDALYGAAARPAAEPVGRDAAAVLFTDEAELVGCLVSDVVGGVAADRWWWEGILPRYGRTTTVASVLSEHPEHVPAVMHLLHERRTAIRAVEAMTDAEADRLSAAVVSTYGGPDPWGPGAGGPAASPWPSRTSVPGGSREAAPYAPPSAPPAAASPGISPARRRFLVIALLLSARPAAAHHPVIRSAAAWPAHQWIAMTQAQLRDDLGSVPAEPSDAGSGATTTADPVAWQAHIGPTAVRPAGGAREPDAPRPTAARRPPNPNIGRTRGPVPRIRDPQPAAAIGHAPVPHDASAEEPPKPPSDRHPARPMRPDADPAEVSRRSHEAPAPETGGSYTAFGGVMYLVNLMAHLGLPECFEKEWRLASRLGAWGALEAIGRGLTAGRPDAASDPIWRLLGSIDGRAPGVVPHLSLDTEPPFRLPWALDPAVDEMWWATRAGRLLVWSAAGIMLAAAPRNDQPPSRQAEALVAGSRRVARRARNAAAPDASVPSGHGLEGPLRTWLELTLPYLRHRLAVAVGIDPAEIVTALLAVPAVVFATRTHIDVVFDLDWSSVAVRLAGLDETPGWVPQFGRVITFHFEDALP